MNLLSSHDFPLFLSHDNPPLSCVMSHLYSWQLQKYNKQSGIDSCGSVWGSICSCFTYISFWRPPALLLHNFPPLFSPPTRFSIPKMLFNNCFPFIYVVVFQPHPTPIVQAMTSHPILWGLPWAWNFVQILYLSTNVLSFAVFVTVSLCEQHPFSVQSRQFCTFSLVMYLFSSLHCC